MKKTLLYSFLPCLVAMLMGATFTACSSSDDEEEVIEEVIEQAEELQDVIVPGIPLDSEAGENPVIQSEEINADIPNISHAIENVEGADVANINMTGIQNKETKEWLRLYGTGGGTIEETATRANNVAQNIWVSIDGAPKGILVINTIDGVVEKKAMNDIVFLVDNSGSMDDEANAIARDIIAWSQKLSQTLDVRFGCVGYNDYRYDNLSGAINLTTAEELGTYLNRSYGTYRTVGFGGADAATLQAAAENYYINDWDECGTMALHFADEQFKFREGANRIYINLTDEPNQPYGNTDYSVEYVSPVNKNWTTTQGTIHTVYSGNKNFTHNYLYNEHPWLMSEYTGGTILYTNSSFTGVDLESLPVSQAMQNSYIIKFTNIANYLDGNPHVIKITILTEDGSVKAEKEFTVTFTAATTNP